MSTSIRMRRILIVVVGIIIVVIISSVSWLALYYDQHSSIFIGVSVNDGLANNNGEISIVVNAEINQTNFLSKFDFNESYPLGLGLWYSDNSTDLVNLTNMSLSATIPFHLDNKHPVFNTTLQIPGILGYYLIGRGPTSFSSDGGFQTVFYYQSFSSVAYFVSKTGEVNQLQI